MNTSGLKVLCGDEGQQFIVFDSVITYKATAEDTGGAYSLALEITPPHSGLPLHVHYREDEAMYIFEGDYEIQCGDQVFQAGAGAFVFLPRDVANRYQNLDGSPGKFLYITSPGGFEQVVKKTSLWMNAGYRDLQKVRDVAGEHDIEFV